MAERGVTTEADVCPGCEKKSQTQDPGQGKSLFTPFHSLTQPQIRLTAEGRAEISRSPSKIPFTRKSVIDAGWDQ